MNQVERLNPPAVDPLPVIDPERRTVRMGDRELRLPETEFQLAAAMARRPGIIIERRAFLDLMGSPLDCSDRAVDSAIKRLRKALRAAFGTDPIVTYHGVGYFWRDPRAG